MSDADVAGRALKLLDLTELGDAPSDHAIDELCAKALDPHGPVAAVCVWPQLVSRARGRLQSSPVRIATVVNFPHGGEDIERVVDDVEEALSDGAHEIDLVMPYRALLRGEPELARDMVVSVRDVVDQGRCLKVILETGVLGNTDMIQAASCLAIETGADFLKTSTGKTPVSATPQAVEAMLGVIRASGRPVGIKPSGRIRTVQDAASYLDLADRIMGPAWVNPSSFRLGASGLFDVLLAAIEADSSGLPAQSPA